MPNNVETRMWLIKRDGSRYGTKVSDKQAVEKFFSQFISISQRDRWGEDPRVFDFNKLIPQPENIWMGAVCGYDDEENLKMIEELGGLEAVKKVCKEDGSFPPGKNPCLSDKQIVELGMVNGLDWNREHWETKWGAYNCQFDFGGTYHVVFDTAWSVPEKILRMVREKAVEQGFDISCEFCGELDDPGVYNNGKFMYWHGEWNEETEELERIGDPVQVYA